MRLLTISFDLTEVTFIFRAAKERGITPGIDFYTIAIKSAAESNLKTAFNILTELQTVHGSGALRNAYTSLLTAIGTKKGPRTDSLQEGLAFLRNVPRLGLKLDSAMYSAAISMALFHAEVPLAEQLLVEAMNAVNHPQLHLYNLQMEILCQQQQPMQALQVFSKLKSNLWLRPNVTTYITLIRIYFSMPVSADEALTLVRPPS